MWCPPVCQSVRFGFIVALQRGKRRWMRQPLLYVSVEVNHSTYSNAVDILSNLKREQT